MFLLLCGLTVLVPVPDKVGNLQTKFEAWSRRLPFFPTMDFLWDREFSAPGLDRDKLEAWKECREDIRAARERLPELLELLDHFDPRVRTLALAALFDREDPAVLPYLARQIKDPALTFPAVVPDYGRGLSNLENLTVGEVAREMVRFWISSSVNPAADFEAYWAQGKGCTSRSGWYAVRLYRAEGGITPFQKERADKVRRVRKEVDRLPSPARDWALLWLASGRPKDKLAHFATEEDLLAAAKRLGPGLLLRLVEGKEVSDDPELAADGKRAQRRSHLVLWVLGQARLLFQAEDAPALLAAEKGFHSPWCAIAAAQLRPDLAARWLREAKGRFPDRLGHERAELAAALWRLRGEEEMGYLADWFYGEKVPDHPPTTCLSIFLDRVAAVRAPADRTLLARLVMDQRLEKLGEVPLRDLVLAINRWTKEPILSDADLYRADPSEKRDKRLARWRAEMRKSVPAWR